MSKPFNAGEIMRELVEEIERDCGRNALRALTAVVLATPVGNPTLWQSPPPPGYVGGHARRNWHVTSGSKSDAELPGVDGAGQLTIAQGMTVITAWERSGVRIGQPLHIQNAVPYIGRLNDGWSTQAPSGFVEKAVLAINGVTVDDGRREL